MTSSMADSSFCLSRFSRVRPHVVIDRTAESSAAPSAKARVKRVRSRKRRMGKMLRMTNSVWHSADAPGRTRPGSGLELVAQAPHGHDVARVGRVRFDLGAQ